ncbi:adenylosuccinate synthase [SAR202 cluster bacterium AD-802-E10_MRT_200m]|nr:adenylosuccinate synthase [SAR202 cluster bacterium AD-802-E10_MRT_200m]
MPAYAVIGGQWGDEGKGKIIDYLAKNVQIVARYSGGNNAGHTVLNEQGEFKLHLVPSGIFWPQVTCVIGNGVVIDLDVLKQEVDGLIEQGIDVSRLQVSDRAHVIMPYHIALDQLEDQARGADALGTTGRGVGPAYMDKTARIGFRIDDLLDLDSIESRLTDVIDKKNALITCLYGGQAFSPDEILEKCRQWGSWIRPFVYPVEQTIRRSLERGENALLEGAQGALLDLDHGTYPYVTSSNPTVGGASTGLGIGTRSLLGVIGIYKAYSTRVGAGPMPSELDDEVGDAIRQRAWEYGTTTGRARRCGWFDAVAARYSAVVNEFSGAILTRLDVLDGFPTIKICVAYQLDGEIIDEFPSSSATLSRCKPIYEELPGWNNPTAGLKTYSDLPKEAQQYINRISEVIQCPVNVISTGPHRHETIERQLIIPG